MVMFRSRVKHDHDHDYPVGGRGRTRAALSSSAARCSEGEGTGGSDGVTGIAPHRRLDKTRMCAGSWPRRRIFLNYFLDLGPLEAVGSILSLVSVVLQPNRVSPPVRQSDRKIPGEPGLPKCKKEGHLSQHQILH